ncbi:MAG TPA: YncE family protein [Xanthobacteraceae bacterium]|jgi:DNA-binding beta-propeller fold protein YncE|nr:YncE family protein [Xanthobacteraceae bacterium]
MRFQPMTLRLVTMIGVVLGVTAARAAPFMIVGDDEKLSFTDGKTTVSPPGKDSVLIVDVANPLDPKIVANLPLKNSVVGPPVNLAVDPTDSLAIVADSMNAVPDGDNWKQVPDNKIYVIDLKAKPAKLVATVEGDKQPSGLSINPAGNLALVANRAGKSISVLSIHGTDVKLVGTVDMGDEVSAVVFTPDGKHALASKASANKVALLDVDGDKVTYNKKDLLTGLFPYNVVVSPNGAIALTADNGNNGTSDGNVDTVSVIDLTDPVHVIDHVTVPDSPEGLAFSPKGNLAVAVDATGSNHPKSDWYYHPHGVVTVLKVDGKKVTRLNDIEVGALPEAVAFTPDGKYIYVGNYMDKDFSILRVDGTKVTDTGKRFKVPGQPGAARMSPH